MSAIKSHQFSSISAAANAFNISKATLTRRINGGTSRECYTPHNKKLTLAEEEVLVREILKLDSQGLSPTTSLVKEIAVRIETSISHRSTTGGKSSYLKEIVRIRLKVSQLGSAKPARNQLRRSRDLK
jgi:hypothetical protein